MPRFAVGLTVEEAKDAETMIEGPFFDGITGLAPGEVRRIDWVQYGGLMKARGSEPVLITSNFKKNKKEMPPIKESIQIIYTALPPVLSDIRQVSLLISMQKLPSVTHWRSICFELTYAKAFS